VLLLMLLFASCANNNPPQVASKPAKDVSVQKEVRKMAADVANDLSVAGPAAWLNYFEQTPAFFMANDGQRVFVNNDSATRFVKEVLAINIMKIKLTWSNVYVDSLSPSLAVLSANYSEVMIDRDNKNINAAGYFTGTAEKTADGWKFRNLHWSSLPKAN
jgi:hypothetical protein